MIIKKIFSLLIINFTVLIADNIGCLDPNNPYYNENVEVGYFDVVKSSKHPLSIEPKNNNEQFIHFLKK
jgi:hypothetical protein